jgi:type I thyroxine 5'-deiodinase
VNSEKFVEISKEYVEKADFIAVYISEAHPVDGWKLDQEICFKQPKTLQQRINIAKAFVKDFDFKVPMYIDLMDNNADHAYMASPERLYIIQNGKIFYQGELGPAGYDLQELEEQLNSF